MTSWLQADLFARSCLHPKHLQYARADCGWPYISSNSDRLWNCASGAGCLNQHSAKNSCSCHHEFSASPHIHKQSQGACMPHGPNDRRRSLFDSLFSPASSSDPRSSTSSTLSDLLLWQQPSMHQQEIWGHESLQSTMTSKAPVHSLMNFATCSCPAVLPQSFSKPEHHSLHPFSLCSPMLSWLQKTVAWEWETGARPTQDVERGKVCGCSAHLVAEAGCMDNESCDCGSNGVCNSILCAGHRHLSCYASLFHPAHLVVPSLTTAGTYKTEVLHPISPEQEHNVQIHLEIHLPWWEHPHVLGKSSFAHCFYTPCFSVAEHPLDQRRKKLWDLLRHTRLKDQHDSQCCGSLCDHYNSSQRSMFCATKQAAVEHLYFQNLDGFFELPNLQWSEIFCLLPKTKNLLGYVAGWNLRQILICKCMGCRRAEQNSNRLS